jgi:hypothetical protein
MNAKRIAALLFALVFLLCGLCCCGSKETLTVDEISQRLDDICFNNVENYEVSKADIENRFNFDGNKLSDYSVRLSNSEEKFICVAVLSLKDKDDKKALTEAFSSVAKDTASAYGTLNASEYSKIQKRLFYEYNDIIIFIVADDYNAPEKYLKEIGAKPIA